MAETAGLCLSPFSSLSSISRLRDASSPLSSHSFGSFSITRHPPPSRFPRVRVKSSSDDRFGFFPWDNETDIQWVPEERVTLFTADGLIQIGGSLVPSYIAESAPQLRDGSLFKIYLKKHGKSRTQKFQRFQESDYLDPNHRGLCLGALFDIAATNGLDMGRRLCIFGFCRSIEMLSDVVEDTVLEHGGEVVAAEKASRGGLNEKLTMTVAVPLLWGVPPASETLHLAVRSGGGIVEKIYWQWDFL